MHTQQPAQRPASIFATSSTMMALTGQASTHRPQPVHLFSSILTVFNCLRFMAFLFINDLFGLDRQILK